MTQYFFSVPGNTTPSSYFTRLPKLLAHLSRHGILKFTLWEGSHEAPRPVKDTPAWSEADYPVDPSAECSAAGLAKVPVKTLEQAVEAVYAANPAGMIADECVTALQRDYGYKWVDYLSIRPRVSTLKMHGILIPTGVRKLSRRGNTCAVLTHRMHWQGGL